MSPTANEVISQKPLSATEIKEILRLDLERLLEGEGLLSHYMAYGRISYDLTLRLHMDNPMMPESKVTVTSKPAPPLADPSPEAVASGTNVHRNISSPNAERLRHALPVPVSVKGQDGTTQTEFIKYPPQPDLGEGDVTVSDVTKDVKSAWKPTEPTT